MSGFFERLLGRNNKTPSSANLAKERLQFVLVHDRINISPEHLQQMKDEILAVISKYVAVSVDKVDIALQQRDRDNSMIVAEIPFSKSLEEQKEGQGPFIMPEVPEEDYTTREIILDLDEDDDLNTDANQETRPSSSP